MKNSKSFFVFFLSLLLTCTCINAETDTDSASDSLAIIHAGTLLSVPGESPQKNKSILVRNGIIDRIEDGFLSAQQMGILQDGIKIVDLKNSFVLPGLIDAHVHLMFEYGGPFRDPIKSGEETLIA